MEEDVVGVEDGLDVNSRIFLSILGKAVDYMHHRKNCSALRGWGRPCDCGYEGIVKFYRRMIEEPKNENAMVHLPVVQPN